MNLYKKPNKNKIALCNNLFLAFFLVCCYAVGGALECQSIPQPAVNNSFRAVVLFLEQVFFKKILAEGKNYVK